MGEAATWSGFGNRRPSFLGAREIDPRHPRRKSGYGVMVTWCVSGGKLISPRNVRLVQGATYLSAIR